MTKRNLALHDATLITVDENKIGRRLESIFSLVGKWARRT